MSLSETTPSSDQPLPSLIGVLKDDLESQFQEIGLKGFRLNQLWHWMYHRGVRNFHEMKNLPKSMIEYLSQNYSLERPTLKLSQVSKDGTQKWLISFNDAQEAEVVHIPETSRGTLCISSQIGCTLTCKFCHTGTQKLVRNLTSSEIVGQVMMARDAFNEWPTPMGQRHISNVVLMGMGEPLYNYDQVSQAIKILTDQNGICLSKRKITLSTSGVVPMIERCGKELGVHLAISLHAVRDDLRDELVPLNRKYPLKELLDACRNYPILSNSKRITFEYVMLKGINDSDADAKELVRLIKGIPSKINLIPFNPWPGSTYECSSLERISQFAEIVYKAGYATPVRAPRGRDILAACGQLKSESQRISRLKQKN